MSGVDIYKGGCTCRTVRYAMLSKPMFVHCCHCTWCQRETGSAFAVNALIECHNVEVVSGAVEIIDTPSSSGKGQKIARCPQCHIALWSHYAGAGQKIHFLRVGTLDTPALFPPDIHIFTSTKQPWVTLPEGVPAVRSYYKMEGIWPPESIERRAALRRKVPIK